MYLYNFIKCISLCISRYVTILCVVRDSIYVYSSKYNNHGYFLFHLILPISESLGVCFFHLLFLLVFQCFHVFVTFKWELPIFFPCIFTRRQSLAWMEVEFCQSRWSSPPQVDWDTDNIETLNSSLEIFQIIQVS